MQDSALCSYLAVTTLNQITMGKSTHFIGLPLYSQVINLLDKAKILQISQKNGGEHYTKRFTVWVHLIVMLYAVIKRFDSLREITTSLLADTKKLAHIGITFKIGRSTLADANKRRSESIFESIYRDLYTRYRNELTQRGVIYVTKMKKSLKYTINQDVMYQTPDGLMEVRLQHVTFSKQLKGGDTITHNARIVTYVEIKKHKLVSLLTNDLDTDPNEIIAIYRQRWEIELLFKQIKQNFPLKYFYGESANAIKIQIWVTLIANLLLMVMQRRLKRRWSFSGLATMMRIALMYYVNFYSLFNNPEKDWELMLLSVEKSPPQQTLFD